MTDEHPMLSWQFFEAENQVSATLHLPADYPAPLTAGASIYQGETGAWVATGWTFLDGEPDYCKGWNGAFAYYESARAYIEGHIYLIVELCRSSTHLSLSNEDREMIKRQALTEFLSEQAHQGVKPLPPLEDEEPPYDDGGWLVIKPIVQDLGVLVMCLAILSALAMGAGML